MRRRLLHMAYQAGTAKVALFDGLSETVELLQDLHAQGSLHLFSSDLRHRKFAITKKAVNNAIGKSKRDSSSTPLAPYADDLYVHRE